MVEKGISKIDEPCLPTGFSAPFEAKESTEQFHNVGIDEGHPSVAFEGEERTGRVLSDAGQFFNIRTVFWDTTASLGEHCSQTAQVLRAPVQTKRANVFPDFIFGSIVESLDTIVFFEKLSVEFFDRVCPCTLEKDLRDERLPFTAFTSSPGKVKLLCAPPANYPRP